MTTIDPRFTLPDLTDEKLAELMGLTIWQVQERCRKGVFVFHWRGNNRGRRFTPEDVEYNRSVGTARTAVGGSATSTITPKMLKGAAKLRTLRDAGAA